MINLQKLFTEVTGLTWNVNKLITAAETVDDKKALLKKLVWLIPDGAAFDLMARNGALQNPPVKTPAIQLVEVLAIKLGLAEQEDPDENVDLSQVFVDFNNDKDVDAYDALTVDDQPIPRPWIVTINIEGEGNGLITTDNNKYIAGTTVELNITPTVDPEEDIYNKLSSIEVIDDSNNKIEINNNTFIMPNSNVTVNAVFEPATLINITGSMDGTGIDIDPDILKTYITFDNGELEDTFIDGEDIVLNIKSMPEGKEISEILHGQESKYPIYDDHGVEISTPDQVETGKKYDFTFNILENASSEITVRYSTLV